jgi:hypothetical protein
MGTPPLQVHVQYSFHHKRVSITLCQHAHFPCFFPAAGSQNSSFEELSPQGLDTGPLYIATATPSECNHSLTCWLRSAQLLHKLLH